MNESKKSIIDSIQKNDHKRVENEIFKNPDLVNALDNQENSFCHYLVFQNKMDWIKNRYFNHIHENKNSNGETVMHFAAQRSFDILKLLITEYGFDTANRTKKGFLPLHYAVANLNLDAVRELLKTKETEIFDLNIAIDILDSFSPQTDECREIRLQLQTKINQSTKFRGRTNQKHNEQKIIHQNVKDDIIDIILKGEGVPHKDIEKTTSVLPAYNTKKSEPFLPPLINKKGTGKIEPTIVKPKPMPKNDTQKHKFIVTQPSTSSKHSVRLMLQKIEGTEEIFERLKRALEGQNSNEFFKNHDKVFGDWVSYGPGVIAIGHERFERTFCYEFHRSESVDWLISGAIFHGSTLMLEYIARAGLSRFDKKIRIRERTYFPLDYALMWNIPPVVGVLVRHGANSEKKNKGMKEIPLCAEELSKIVEASAFIKHLKLKVKLSEHIKSYVYYLAIIKKFTKNDFEQISIILKTKKGDLNQYYYQKDPLLNLVPIHYGKKSEILKYLENLGS